MKQKELIDACNDMPLSMCVRGQCPYDEKECESYMEKYGTVPHKENDVNPERYTDDVI